MQTIHLTEDHVAAYLTDFAHRITQLGKETPNIWAVVGASGSIIGKRLATLAPTLHNLADDVIVAYNRAKDQVTFPTEKNPSSAFKNRRVLLIDGTVHSGSTLIRIIKEIKKFKVAGITSYALAVRRGSKVIPNHFGFLIGDHDRVQFPSLRLANNCLCEYGVYRKLSAEDAERKMIRTGEDFIDKISWEDRLYEIANDTSRQVYLHEKNDAICGFISFRFKDGKTVFVDEIAIDKNYRKQGLGGHLMRWAEHCARHRDCTKIELWAVDDQVDFYRYLGYESADKRPLRLSKHKFWRMHKKLLYNLANDETLAMGH
jgi:N-acetylglutamate synthase-like GNAT family acetyltransferase/hypoxanthine-guanine phosphoribosyltransferase